MATTTLLWKNWNLSKSNIFSFDIVERKLPNKIMSNVHHCMSMSNLWPMSSQRRNKTLQWDSWEGEICSKSDKCDKCSSSSSCVRQFTFNWPTKKSECDAIAVFHGTKWRTLWTLSITCCAYLRTIMTVPSLLIICTCVVDHLVTHTLHIGCIDNYRLSKKYLTKTRTETECISKSVNINYYCLIRFKLIK